MVARPGGEDRSEDREALFVLDELGAGRWMPADSRMEERDANEAGSVYGNLRWLRTTWMGRGESTYKYLQGRTACLPRVGVRA